MNANYDLWAQHFAHVGDNDGHKFVKDGPRDYIMYGSGRIYVEKVYGLIRLEPRHDWIEYFMDKLSIGKVYDKVTINCVLNSEESDDITFAILPRDSASSILKKRWDLDNFPKPRDLPGFPKQVYTLLTDAPEFTNLIWGLPSVKKALWGSVGKDENGDDVSGYPVLEQISLSNLPPFKPEKLEDLKQPKTLQLVFKIPELSAESLPLQSIASQVAFDIVDTIGKHGRLSAEGKQKAKRLRTAAEQTILKQFEEERKRELADKKVAEKKQLLENIQKLSPESQRKAEEKLRKKEQKKQQAKKMKRI
ncbi:hypothetical protein HDV01_000652 [Terramyces sp. JEL0728]|nr:hypothetical protein HDV01_000652 [Terramyces sp. JEL0728]